MESFFRAFLHPSSSDSATSRGARSEDKGGTEEDMQDDAMVDTDSSSDKEICKVDKHKLYFQIIANGGCAGAGPWWWWVGNQTLTSSLPLAVGASTTR